MSCEFVNTKLHRDHIFLFYKKIHKISGTTPRDFYQLAYTQLVLYIGMQDTKTRYLDTGLIQNLTRGTKWSDFGTMIYLEITIFI